MRTDERAEQKKCGEKSWEMMQVNVYILGPEEEKSGQTGEVCQREQ